MSFQLRSMTAADREEVARLIFHSTNRYYESIGRDAIFTGDELDTGVMIDVYDQLDPGQAIVAVDDSSQQVIGSCFVHPRETHVSLGIMNSHPDHFGRGVARALLAHIIELAQAQDKPVRLVSSCLNLDSYSLYTRAGFVPFCTFQDMYLQVPESGLAVEPPAGHRVRPANEGDLEAMAAIEQELSGITRMNDYRYFLQNPDQLWHVSVVEGETGIDGFLVSCGAAAFNMLGPGVARGEDQAAALIHAELNQYPGRMPVFLVPVAGGDLVQRLYSWGARNCEMHVAQAHGSFTLPRGVTMPTFLPETG
ncbi:MAG: GNAT family N-acetyltransferase [Planctomycetota bacterium]|nr:GNAT family N-acetyltransferase [Planctomycetota bacterium]